MKMKALKNRRTYRLESLESRHLLSARVLPAVAVQVAGLHGRPGQGPSNQIHEARASRGAGRFGARQGTSSLSGTIGGTFQIRPGGLATLVADVNGTGNIRPLGPVVATGTLSGVAAPGSPVQGQMTLTDATGNAVVLALSGTAPGDLRSSPEARVTVVGGTGAYARLRGAGTATLVLGGLAPDGSSGTFTATIRPSNPRRR